jgi:hypothetical protein
VWKNIKETEAGVEKHYRNRSRCGKTLNKQKQVWKNIKETEAGVEKHKRNRSRCGKT